MKRSTRHRYSDTYALVARDNRLGRALRFPTLPLADDESLVGLITRATADHVLYAVTNVIRRVGVNVRQPGFVSRLEPERLAPLGAILQCGEEAILQRVTPLERGDIARSNVLVGELSAPPEWLETEKRRISPMTLRDAPYHRTDWLFRLLPYCPVSLELLQDRCLACGRTLSWRKTLGIDHCENCEILINPSVEPPLPPNLEDGYRLFAGLLSPVVDRLTDAIAMLPKELQSMKRHDLINFCIDLGLACRSDPISISRKCIARCEAETLADVVSTGATFAAGWPQSIIVWSKAEAERLIPQPEQFHALRKRLQRLGKANSISADQKRIVRKALPHLFTNYVHSFADRRDIIFSAEICKMLPLRMADLELLRAAGHLEFRELPSKAFYRIQYDARQIKAVHKRYHASSAATCLAAKLGLPLYALEQAACLGVVTAEPDPVIRQMRETLSLTLSSSSKLIEALNCNMRHGAAPSDARPLGTAARRVGGKLKPWGHILRDLKGGKLAYWLLEQDLPFSRRIVIMPKSLARYDDLEWDEAAWPHGSFEKLLTKNDAAEILNVNSVNFSTVLEHLESIPSGKAQLVHRAEVIDYAKQVISSAEIDQLADSNPRRTKFCLRHYTHLRRPGGWDRDKLLNLDAINGVRAWQPGFSIDKRWNGEL